MGVHIIGSYPILQRKRTGLFSYDMALRRKGELGQPTRTIIELFGRPESGKSTLAYYLSGSLSESGDIFLCDVDKMLDREYLASAIGVSGFNGNVHIADSHDEKGKPITHEKMLMWTMNSLRNETAKCAIVDSVGGIEPQVENKEDEEFGQAFMGQRAKLVGQVVRRASGILRDKDEGANVFFINHYHSVIGGRGHVTPGGEALKHKASTRIYIWSSETFRDDDKDVTYGFLVKGVTEKHTFGGKGRQFTFYIVPEYGVHVGVSAMFDCFTYGLATRGARVKLGDKNIGFINADLLSYAAEGKTRKFDVFQDALAEYEETMSKEGIDVDDRPDTTEPE